jgi:hypothetical protein
LHFLGKVLLIVTSEWKGTQPTVTMDGLALDLQYLEYTKLPFSSHSYQSYWVGQVITAVCFVADYDVPCVDGKQQFKGYAYPGILTKHPTGTEDYSIRGKFRVPANLHVGNIGLAPKYKPDEAVNSIPPTRTGGNMDNRRVGMGATMYFPVEVREGGDTFKCRVYYC